MALGSAALTSGSFKASAPRPPVATWIPTFTGLSVICSANSAPAFATPPATVVGFSGMPSASWMIGGARPAGVARDLTYAGVPGFGAPAASLRRRNAGTALLGGLILSGGSVEGAAWPRKSSGETFHVVFDTTGSEAEARKASGETVQLLCDGVAIGGQAAPRFLGTDAVGLREGSETGLGKLL